ncbi:DeoR family transcriptional regulator [Bifidobacterium dolichotidis]|uniref:DeoR family transcriptional regulator n=1 Tax=Bifidobacterium dolichotidis TaxID=2306976 RepID=A0A430FQP1_9BIFI|nr:diacylglycerol kinase family protein [Bifidobacterium dolichotidis]RSX55157.1 DeoR family transcriptional regulator [Bifidobacterium dolichotidis]
MEQEHGTIAVIGNPVSGKGAGAKALIEVKRLLEQQGETYGFAVLDLTGDSFDDSLHNATTRADEYDYLVVVGGDGMIALGANAVGGTKKPLGIVAMGSGNDFARGMGLPVNRLETAVEGIVGAVVRKCSIDVDLGLVKSLPGSRAVDTSTGNELETPQPIHKYFGGMLSCGLDANVNDRANHSHVPNGPLRYFLALVHEVLHMKEYGYHIEAVLTDNSTVEYDITSSLLTVANSRHIGGGIEVSPYSRFNDGLLDLVWLKRKPTLAECAVAVKRSYASRMLSCPFLGWQRVREVKISYSGKGEEPPILLADGEYMGSAPVDVTAVGNALRVLVPPAVAEAFNNSTEEETIAAIRRDGRDPLTGLFEEADAELDAQD